MSTPNYGEAAQKFVDAGIHPRWLLPIAPVGAAIGKSSTLSDKVLGKAPGRFIERAASWTGLRGFVIVEGVTKADFAEFSTWPTHNVGVLGRAYPGIDSDAETPEAKRIVETALDASFGKDAVFAERVRGTGPRRLYAFACVDAKDPNSWVRTRHLTYTLRDGSKHKLDVIGYGGQYVIDGTHPSGDKYEWDIDFPLVKLADELTQIDNEDMERFIEAFKDLVDRAGGTVLRASGGSGGGGDDLDVRDLEPVMAPRAVFDGLAEIENGPDTFLHRDDFVSALAAIRAALGKESCERDVENGIFEWATKDPEWCDEDYFDKIWKSLDRVRVPRDSLDRLFRRFGVKSHVKYTFDDAAPKALRTEITKKKQVARDEKSDLLDTAASRYYFGHINTRDNKARVSMRDRWIVDREWVGIDWWKGEIPEADRALLASLHEIDTYPMNKVGFANFLRDIQALHPENWYSAETNHPSYDKGEIVSEEEPDGSIRREINMRHLAPAIREARKTDPDPKRSQADVAHILDFVNRLFGKMAKYELDTLAYMAQSGDRPGSLLFLVGDQGVGKSIWLNMLMTLFDGIGPNIAVIDGAKLMNENARRFMLARVEGCRIVTIRELPEGGTSRDMAAITSQLKQIVDPGPEGDYITIERKGENAHPIRNHSRVLISSNYGNAIHIEQQDRRIFFVQCQITLENKPDEDFYGRLVDITADPTRLAALWRYLKTRDIGNYSRYSEPPVSTEKAERIIAEITNPADRHLRAALELYRHAERQAFDTQDLAETMTRMATNEWANSGGAVDDRKVYKYQDDNGKSPVEFMNAIRLIKPKQAIKLDRPLRTSKKRYPAVYVLPDHASLAADMMTWERDDILDFMDRECGPRDYPEHPWRMYRDAKKGGE